MNRFVLAVAVLVAGQAGAQTLGDEMAREANFRWQCRDTGRNSKQCTVENRTWSTAELCVQVVKVCKDGDHVATLCSGVMRPGEMTNVVLREFEPKVKLFEKCMGTEFREKTITRQ